MKPLLYAIAKRCQLVRYAQEERATALIETVILFPVLIALLMAVYDLGQGINMNQKTIGAAQIIGDLVARDESVTMASLQNIIKAGELALAPADTAPFGYDIVSIEFDDDGDPTILWRVTVNTAENVAAVNSTAGLGAEGDGVIVVTAAYNYDPYFSHFAVNNIAMKEVAFLRGRKSSVVTCADCPGG